MGRFHNVYGPRMGVDHVIPELCLRALDREDPFRVFGPEQRRAFCHVADALEAITSLMATERPAGRSSTSATTPTRRACRTWSRWS